MNEIRYSIARWNGKLTCYYVLDLQPDEGQEPLVLFISGSYDKCTEYLREHHEDYEGELDRPAPEPVDEWEFSEEDLDLSELAPEEEVAA